MFQDFVIAARYVVFGSLEEWAILALLMLLVGALLVLDHRRRGEGAPFARHVASTFGLRAPGT